MDGGSRHRQGRNYRHAIRHEPGPESARPRAQRRRQSHRAFPSLSRQLPHRTSYTSSASAPRTSSQSQGTQRVDNVSSLPPLAFSPSPPPSLSPKRHLPRNLPSTNSSLTSPRSPRSPASSQATSSLRQSSSAIQTSRNTQSWTSYVPLHSLSSTLSQRFTRSRPAQYISPTQPSPPRTIPLSRPSPNASTTFSRRVRQPRLMGYAYVRRERWGAGRSGMWRGRRCGRREGRKGSCFRRIIWGSSLSWRLRGRWRTSRLVFPSKNEGVLLVGPSVTPPLTCAADGSPRRYDQPSSADQVVVPPPADHGVGAFASPLRPARSIDSWESRIRE